MPTHEIIQKEKPFSIEEFSVENNCANPGALLPKNINDCWLNKILDGYYHYDNGNNVTGLIYRICLSIDGAIPQKLLPCYVELYLRELTYEKFARAGAITYKAAELKDFFNNSRLKPSAIALEISDRQIFAIMQKTYQTIFPSVLADHADLSNI